MAAIRQSSFAGGELSPTLHGRTDLDVYRVGLRRSRNGWITKHGAWMSRPGLKRLGAAALAGFASRLEAFIWSDDTAYVIEFASGRLRVWFDDALLNINGVGWINTTWNNVEVFELKVAQIGDILTICHKSEQPYELTRTGHTTWALTAVSFDVPAYGGIKPRMWDASTSVPPQTTNAGGEYVREWAYKVTELRRYDDGRLVETLPEDVTETTDGTLEATKSGDVPAEFIVSQQFPVRIAFRTGGLLGTGTGYEFIGTRIYRGRGSVFGLVGEVEGSQGLDAGGFFKDFGEEPDYSRPPPSGRNPFEILDTDGSALRTERPTVVGYFEQRMVFGAMVIDDTAYRPGTLLFSKTNDLLNFDRQQILTADGPIEITLAARRREQIRAILGLDRLLVFSDQGVWVVGAEGALSPVDLVQARRHADVGIVANVDPIVVDDTVLYVRAKGTGIRELAFSNERGAFAGGNISFLAQHLFEGYEITALCYAEDPHGLVWALRSDGKLLSLTYDRSAGLVAWSWHDTNGVIESICTVPAGSEDQLWACVKRTIGGSDVRSIERLASRVVDSVADAICLDAAITVSAPGSSVISGLSSLEGEEVWALADGQVFGPYTVLGGAIELEELVEDPPDVVHVGLRFVPEIELLDLADARDKQKIVKSVAIDVEGSRGLYVGEALPASDASTEGLSEWRQREVDDAYAAMELFTGQAEVSIRGRWNRHGRVALRQVDPLPLTVLGVTREGVGGG